MPDAECRFDRTTRDKRDDGAARPNAGRFRLGRQAPALIGFGIFSAVISLGFFWEALHTRLSELNGDQVNILTICVKKDYPDRLPADLLAGDTKNLTYYIPAYVDLVRLFSLPDQDYTRGLSILLLLTSFLYMWGWWMLFSIWGDKWTAAILAFFVRGIIWPPGNEVWGIAGLWSMLPRTLFLALLPWVLWAWFRLRRSRRGWLLVCFSMGVLANVHPVSAAGTSLALILADSSWTALESRRWRPVASRFFSGTLFLLLGMSHYIWTYLTGIRRTNGVNPAEFDEAFQMRITPVFLTPGSYLERSLHPAWLMLILIPWVVCLITPRRYLAAHKGAILALAVFSLGCLIAALCPFVVEEVLREFGYEARFAFQLVRSGKYVIVPSFILIALFCALTRNWLESRLRHGRALVISVSCLAVILTLFSRQPVFDGVPVLGDDVCRFLWPQWNKATASRETESMDALLAWIRENTTEDAKFIGPRQIRIGGLRSVIHDSKGAALLIEANPEAFVGWARRTKTLEQAENDEPVQRAKLFASWGADYWVTRRHAPDLSLVYSNAVWFVYDLRDDSSL